MNKIFLNYYLAAYIVLYFLLVFVIPSYITYKKTKINPFVFSKEDNVHNYVGFIMKISSFFLMLIVFVIAFFEDSYSFFIPVFYLEYDLVKLIGLVLMHLALFWIILAQIHMGISWRIGIDNKNKTELKTHGIFSLSRNPVFLGIIVSMFSLFLVLPSSYILLFAFIIYIVIQIQVRLEEEFLTKSFGIEYHAYQLKVRRWL